MRRLALALPARLALALMLVGLLASCRSPKYLDTVKLEPVCPRVGVLGDADRVTEFSAAAGQDITDIAFDARLMGVKGSCQFDEENQTVTLVMDVQFSATRGPSYRDAMNLSYFVATLDDAKNVIGRQQFDLAVRFGSDQVRIEGAEQLSESYALKKKDALGAAYQVLVGFVLTPAQLAYNRSHR
jgi:hypothetical protein